VFVAMTFVPILAVHPFRVERLRWLTCLIAALWTGAAAVAVANPFPSPLWVKALLVATAIYLASVGIVRSLFRPDQAR
jgi:phosphatidylcholine synthase